MLPSSTEQWVMLVLGLLAGYYIVKHFCVSGGSPV